MRKCDPLKRAAQESRILATARQLFAERGYGETTMQDIATAMGVTKAALYHYYQSKEAILTEILRLRADEHDKLIDGALRAEDLSGALKRLADGFFKSVRRPEGRQHLLILVSEGVKRTQVGELFHGILRRYVRDFASGAVRRGMIQPGGEEECRALLYAYMGGLVHYVLDRIYHGIPAVDMEEERYSRLLSSVVASGLGARFAPKSNLVGSLKA